MTILVAAAFMCTSLLVMSSCGGKQVVVDGKTDKVSGTTDVTPPATPATPGTPIVKKEGYSKEKIAEATKKLMQEKEDEAAKRKAAGKAILAEAVRIFESTNIYFDYDSFALKPIARNALIQKAKWLKANPQYSVKIEGHCDERGTSEYNLALGERRADAAWRFLNALGISGNRLTSVSYGEEKPEAMESDEVSWARNRRAEFKLVR